MSHEPEIDLTNDSDDSGPEVDDVEEKKLLESDDDDVRPISPPPPTKSPPTKKIRVESIKLDEKPKEQQGPLTMKKLVNGYTIPKLSSSSSSSSTTTPSRPADLFGIQQRESNVQRKQGTSSRVSEDENSIKQTKENHRVQNNNTTTSNSNSNSTTSFNNVLSTPTTPTNLSRAAPRKTMIYGGSRMSISSSPAGVGAPRKLVAKSFISGGRNVQNGDLSIVDKSRVQPDHDKSDEENNDDGSESDTSTCSKRSDDSDSTEFPEFAQAMKDIDEKTKKAGPRRSQILPTSTEQQAGPEVYYLCDDDEDAYEELMEKFRGSKGAISNDDLYCEHCDKKYSQVNRFIVHHRRHFFHDHYKCTICHRGFTNLNLCLIHEIHEHGDDNNRREKLQPFVKCKKGELQKMLQNTSSAKNKNKMTNGHSSSRNPQPNSSSEYESSDEEVVDDFCLNGRTIPSTSLTVYRGPSHSVKHLSDAFEVELKQQKTGDLGQQIKSKRMEYI